MDALTYDYQTLIGNVMSNTDSKNVLILFAHPSQDRSEVNVPLFQHALGLSDIATAVDLYAEYPRMNIDIDREQQRLIDHNTIILMFPFYWYSTPAILKEWQDLVLEYGFAYGECGNALEGKTMLCAITAGATPEAYQADGLNQYSIPELLRPLEQTAHLTKMRYLPPLVLFGARTAVEEQRIEKHRILWDQLLKLLAQKPLDMAKSQQFPLMNEFLEKSIVNTHGAV